MNNCFEGLEERMGLNRVREFIQKAGLKKNERVKVSSDSWDLERPAEILGGQSTDGAVDARLERSR